jgi:hypothetical protein
VVAAVQPAEGCIVLNELLAGSGAAPTTRKIGSSKCMIRFPDDYLVRHSGSPPISGLPEIGTSRSKSATAALDGGKSGIHIHGRWLWIPGSSRSLSSGRPLRAGPVGSAPE